MALVSFSGAGKDLAARHCSTNGGNTLVTGEISNNSPAPLLAEPHIVPSTYHVIESQVQALKIQLPGTAAHFHNAIT